MAGYHDLGGAFHLWKRHLIDHARQHPKLGAETDAALGVCQFFPVPFVRVFASSTTAGTICRRSFANISSMIERIEVATV